MVGQVGFVINSIFDQSPCLYQQDYSYEVLDEKKGTEASIDFFSFLGETIEIGTPKSEHIGKYLVKVCSTIHNLLMTTACSEFMITVNAAPSNKTVSIEPEFMISLQN